MERKKASIFVRAIKYAAISSTIIMLFAIYRGVTAGVSGSATEAFIRYLLTAGGSFLALYLVFVLHLYFNPDADEPRK